MTSCVASATQCVDIDANGYIYTTSNSECRYLLITTSEYKTTNANLIELLNSLFVFDSELFQELTAQMLGAFVTAFGAGFVVRWLGKR